MKNGDVMVSQTKSLSIREIAGEMRPRTIRKRGFVRVLQNCGFVQKLAPGEALEAKHRGVVYHIGLARQDQIRDDFAGGGRVHHAVSAEAVGKKESRRLGDGPQY